MPPRSVTTGLIPRAFFARSITAPLSWHITTHLPPPLAPSGHPAPFSKMAYSDLKTPQHCYVDFCLIPVGTGSTSISSEIAEVQKVLKASGLPYTMHSAGTTVEGSWDEVMKAVGQAHSVVHRSGAVRVQSSMRVGSRTDRVQTAAEKIKSVQDKLAQDKGK